jgi:hypothetical protein
MESTYYNILAPASYGGLSKFKPKGYTKKQVREWLQSQDTCTLHKPTRRRINRGWTLLSFARSRCSFGLSDVSPAVLVTNQILWNSRASCISVPLSPADERLKLYDQSFTRYLNVYDDYRPRSVAVAPEPMKQDLIDNEILESVPKTMNAKVHRIYLLRLVPSFK